MKPPRKKTVTVRHYRGQAYIGERQYSQKSKFTADLYNYLQLTDRWVEVEGPTRMVGTLGKVKGRTGVPRREIETAWDLA